MTYRDELGALYAKVEALESKLKERDPQDEHIAELKSLKEKVRAIEAGRLPAARMTTWLVACVGLSLFTSLLVSAIVSSPATKTPEEIIKELPKVEMPPASLGSSFMVDAPKEPVAKAPPAPTATSSRWPGKITASQGMPWSVGDSCFVEMPVGEFDWSLYELHDLYIYCSSANKKDELVYSWARGTGAKTFQKYLQVDGKYKGLGAFEATERGISMEQPELMIDTTKKQVRLFYSVSNEPKEMTISLERMTAPVTFVYQKDDNTFPEYIWVRETTTHQSTVKEKAGAVPASLASACSLQVGPYTTEYKAYKTNCLVSLTCGEFSSEKQAALCVFNEDESLKSLSWKDRGQSLSVDFNAHTGKLLDVSGATSWGVDLILP